MYHGESASMINSGVGVASADGTASGGGKGKPKKDSALTSQTVATN